MEEQMIHKILEAGSQAPSGENAQPWHFRARAQESGWDIDIHIVPDRDHSSYAWGNRSAYFAAGCALENIVQAAEAAGFSAKCITPEKRDPLHVVQIHLRKNAHAKKTNVANYIDTRSTNRKPFSKEPLATSVLEDLKTSVGDDASLFIIDDRDEIIRLAQAASVAERVMLGNKKMHTFFFEHINWDRAQDEAVRSGFFIETLELPPPARVGFKVMRSWKRASFLNRLLGFNKMIATQNAAIYSSASAIGIIATPNESINDAISAGRAFERLWLTVCKNGLSLQPLAGMLFLSLAVEAGQAKELSEADVSLVRSARDEVRTVGKMRESVPYMMFRIGRANPPTARSLRLPKESIITIEP